MLESNQTGLSTAEAEMRLAKFGLNDVAEKKTGVIKKFLAPLYSPISLMLLGAALLSRLNGRIFDFYFILSLYLVNYSIQKWHEFKADKAIAELQNQLAFNVSTLREGAWVFINAKHLVPGDTIRLGLGSVIPADCTVTATRNLSVNEAVLSGESLPKIKNIGDQIYSGSFIATGNLEAEVKTTGKNTNFGKTLFSIEQSTEKSILEKDILNITRFLTIISVIATIILTIVFLLKGLPFEDILTLDLSLIIAGIPIALPAVMAIILSIGAAGLTKKLVVVRRLSALQDLANVNMLLTDKTGTLTKNEIVVANVISYQSDLSTDDIIDLAYHASSVDTPDAIDHAIVQKFADSGRDSTEISRLSFIPYDSDRKRTTSLIQKGTEKILISLGAPQVVVTFDEAITPELRTKFETDIDEAAKRGFRVLAVAMKTDGIEEKQMPLAGLLFLADPLDENSKAVIQFMRANGIGVKMLTGDNQVIAERIAKELDLKGEVLSAKATREFCDIETLVETRADEIGVFAEILPKDKYDLVKKFRTSYIVASTGDGINDLPALKTANVGIAVSGAVSALKGSADIVLLGPGLSVIRDAILESRKIFTRLYSYSVYRISETFRLVITVLILGLWYGFYPLLPLQLIILAFLNDLPIISLAVDRVKVSAKPAEINSRERFQLSVLFGLVGVVSSVSLFVIMTNILHLPLAVIQTIFFLKLTVSGHALIFVAHTKERWWRFLPSKQVLIATLGTQIIATILAVTGWLMPEKISLATAGLIWLWVLFWMQISEAVKPVVNWWNNRTVIPK